MGPGDWGGHTFWATLDSSGATLILVLKELDILGSIPGFYMRQMLSHTLCHLVTPELPLGTVRCPPLPFPDAVLASPLPKMQPTLTQFSLMLRDTVGKGLPTCRKGSLTPAML